MGLSSQSVPPDQPVPSGVTRLLRAAAGGDRDALEQLFPIVYDELHRLARCVSPGDDRNQTLQPTALVNEAYIRLVEAVGGVQCVDRHHFLSLAARVMRQILADYARAQQSLKRGGDRTRIPLMDNLAGRQAVEMDVVELDDALSRLAAMDAQHARLAELRLLGGLSIDESAGALGLPVPLVKAEWRVTRAWLRAQLSQGLVP